MNLITMFKPIFTVVIEFSKDSIHHVAIKSCVCTIDEMPAKTYPFIKVLFGIYQVGYKMLQHHPLPINNYGQ